MRTLIIALTLAPLLSGCDLAPQYARPGPAVPSQFPIGPAYSPVIVQTAAGLPWRALISDVRLRALIEAALRNNQNLAAIVANVASVRAQYRVQRSAQLPTLTGEGGTSIVRGITPSSTNSQSFDANVGVSSFEIDLFGRLKNLSKAAFEQYLASDEGMRTTQIALIAETINAFSTCAADRDLLTVAQDTLASGNRTLQLTRSLHDTGLAAGTDVANAETVVAQAHADVEQYTTQIAQDRNALELLVGGPVGDAQLPGTLTELENGVGIMPAGVSSTVLLQRPDVLQAEHQLRAASASIGAARAAFFPTITLTSALGVASQALSALFTGGALSFSATPQASLPILGGANRGNLAYAEAQSDYYLATYRYTVQTAFREVADGLARRGTIGRQRAAQDELLAAATRSYHLAEAQYRAGTDTFLNTLTAQRTLYAARQARVSVILEDFQNRVALFQYLGVSDNLDPS